jgi:Papain-like cysteine protease AvrRpt2
MEIVLPIPVMAQELRLWCWAAIASGVSQLGGAPFQSQCDVATKVIGLACCATPAACNTTQDLTAAITSIPMSCVATGPVDFSTLANQIQVAGRPVGVRLLNRLDFSAHFVLITGCDPAMQTVISTDPWGTVGMAAPRYRMLFSDVHNYGNWGTWTHSFIIS